MRIRLALVGPVDSRSGVGEYCKSLYPELEMRLADTCRFPVTDRNYDDLLESLDVYKPTTVLVDCCEVTEDVFRFAFVLQRRGCRVLVRPHSIRNPQLLVNLPEILVHTEPQLDLLEKIVKGSVHLIPHGVADLTEGLQATLGGRRTLVQFGFGEAYKGWRKALEVTKLLVSEFPDLQLVQIFSDSGNRYYTQIADFYEKQIVELSLQNNAVFWRSFYPFESLKLVLRGSSCTIFPYIDYGKGNVLAASGAARLALSCGAKVVTTKLPIFAGLEDLTLWGETVEELADQVRRVLRNEWNPNLADFLTANSWGKVASMHVGLFLS